MDENLIKMLTRAADFSAKEEVEECLEVLKGLDFSSESSSSSSTIEH